MAARPRILVAPLDWGLGHATRCVPIIEAIQQQGGKPVIATAGRALAYLKAEFPALPFVPLPAYAIRYFSDNMPLSIAVQAPKLLRAVWLEHRQLQQAIHLHRIDAVISDNRFGCFSSRAHSVFITHQTRIPIPSPPLQWLANRLNHWFIRRYDEYWIPDRAGPDSLSGSLSLPLRNFPCQHIGLLSRLRPKEEHRQYDILALLSGPEPQRSHLEEMLVRQLKPLPYRVLIVQGKTEEQRRYRLSPHIEIVSYLNARTLQSAMSRSALAICRSGYSTIMDLAVMGKKALLIPTPGQTEQEYLARRIQQMGYCPFHTQHELDVEKGVREAGVYPGFPKYLMEKEKLEIAVQGLINRSKL